MLVQVLLVQLDEPTNFHARVAAVLSDGTRMVAVELRDSALAAFINGTFFEGDMVRIGAYVNCHIKPQHFQL